MSGTTDSASLYGPATALLQSGATAHVSPYSSAGAMAMATKDFPRDPKGRFTWR